MKRTGQSEYVRQYAIDHIHEESASAFSELCSLLAYGKEHKEGYAATPFTWNRELTELEYYGCALAIAAFKDFLVAVCSGC